MEQTVSIKGTKSGIILVLDSSMPFEELSVQIAARFREAASFLGRNDMGLLVRGRKVSEEEMDRIVTIIHENSNLHISCILDDESEMAGMSSDIQRRDYKDTSGITAGNVTESLGATNAAFNKLSDAVEDSAKRVERQELTSEDFPGENALIYRGTLRSGQDISSKKSIVLLGDVKPGANVTSYGSIYVLGELRGNAFAGAGGDEKAIIMALELEPIQLRIAQTIAISPDAEKGAKIKVKRKRIIAPPMNEPEVAYIENGNIVKTRYDAAFLRKYL